MMPEICWLFAFILPIIADPLNSDIKTVLTQWMSWEHNIEFAY